MNSWIHIGHMTILLLLVIAATACLILAAELWPHGALDLRLCRFGFGPFYMFVSIAFVIFIAIPAFAIPSIYRVIERLSMWQLVWRSAAIALISLVLAVVYVIAATMAGLPMPFGA